MRRVTVGKYGFWPGGPMVILAAVLLSGIGAANAGQSVQPYANAHTSHVIRDRSVDPKLPPAARARALKAAAIKKKQEARKFIEDVAVDEQGAASVSKGKEGAK